MLASGAGTIRSSFGAAGSGGLEFTNAPEGDESFYDIVGGMAVIWLPKRPLPLWGVVRGTAAKYLQAHFRSNRQTTRSLAASSHTARYAMSPAPQVFSGTSVRPAGEHAPQSAEIVTHSAPTC